MHAASNDPLRQTQKDAAVGKHPPLPQLREARIPRCSAADADSSISPRQRQWKKAAPPGKTVPSKMPLKNSPCASVLLGHGPQVHHQSKSPPSACPEETCMPSPSWNRKSVPKFHPQAATHTIPSLHLRSLAHRDKHFAAKVAAASPELRPPTIRIPLCRPQDIY